MDEELEDLENNHGALLLTLINKFTEQYQAIISNYFIYIPMNLTEN